jgi:hypothetical protein
VPAPVVKLPAMDIFRKRERDGWRRGGSGEHGREDQNRGWPRETTAFVDP